MVFERLLVIDELRERDFEMDADLLSVNDSLENDRVVDMRMDRVSELEFEMLLVGLNVCEVEDDKVNEWLLVRLIDSDDE